MTNTTQNLTTEPKPKVKRAPRAKVAAAPVQPIEKLPPNPFQYEILQLISNQSSDSIKVDLLREYRNPALVSLLIWNFDESVVSILPPGDVPYSSTKDQSSGNDTLSGSIQKQLNNPSKVDEYMNSQRTSLINEYKNFYNYIRGGNDSLSKLRRETMFIQVLEGLHPLEAELLILVKDKHLTNKYNVSYAVVKESYQDIQWGGRS